MSWTERRLASRPAPAAAGGGPEAAPTAGRAPAPWLQRVGAACAAVVIGLALLAPQPSAAVSEGAGDSHTSEIGASGCARVSVAPNPNPMKRGAESTAVSVRLDVAPKATATAAPAHGVAHAGSEAPALARWRIAHGTSTASP